MADLAVVQVAVGAWLSTLVAALAALLTALILPRWVKVSIDADGVVEEVDVGLWQMCRTYESLYNCTWLNPLSTIGKIHLEWKPPALLTFHDCQC